MAEIFDIESARQTRAYLDKIVGQFTRKEISDDEFSEGFGQITREDFTNMVSWEKAQVRARKKQNKLLNRAVVKAQLGFGLPDLTCKTLLFPDPSTRSTKK